MLSQIYILKWTERFWPTPITIAIFNVEFDDIMHAKGYTEYNLCVNLSSIIRSSLKDHKVDQTPLTIENRVYGSYWACFRFCLSLQCWIPSDWLGNIFWKRSLFSLSHRQYYKQSTIKLNYSITFKFLRVQQLGQKLSLKLCYVWKQPNHHKIIVEHIFY